MNKIIPIIIPAYEPDKRLVQLVRDLVKDEDLVVIVDDGSGFNYISIFEECSHILGDKGIILTHDTNMGKGCALKTAFAFVLENYPEIVGVVTADSDGQHNKMSIDSVKEVLRDNQESLVLGVRCFDNDGIPWKSIFGNKLTVKILQYVSGIKISDTQTGLRGIPREFARRLINIKGERFEFETEMLIDSSGKYPIIEIPISTIYDSEENHQTHFHPILDSLKIYQIFGKIFLKYVLSSFSSSLLDLVLFSIFCYLLNDGDSVFCVFVSTVLARMISAVYNYLINYKMVFCSGENVKKPFAKYSLLVILQMCFSASCVTLGVHVFSNTAKIVIKIIVDTVLFFISYHVQREYVFQ